MAVTLGSSGLVFSDNSTDATAVGDKGALISISTYTSSGTYTIPSNCTKVYIQLVGGGGGSAGYCESGGAGGYSEGVYSVTPGTDYAVTVGGGGGAVGYYAAAGDGGTTSFGALISASGGYGANRNYGHGGGHSGTGTGGQVNLSQGTGTGHANYGSHGQSGLGGGTFFGGGPGKTRGVGGGNFSGAYGTGATGDRCQDGSSGDTGRAGIVIIYAYK